MGPEFRMPRNSSFPCRNVSGSFSFLYPGVKSRPVVLLPIFTRDFEGPSRTVTRTVRTVSRTVGGQERRNEEVRESSQPGPLFKRGKEPSRALRICPSILRIRRQAGLERWFSAHGGPVKLR